MTVLIMIVLMSNFYLYRGTVFNSRDQVELEDSSTLFCILRLAYIT